MIILAVLGVLQILGGAYIWSVAQSAIHEILAALLIGFGFLMIGLAVIAWRLDALLVELRGATHSLFAIRHPEVPWPPLPPSLIVHEEWRGGQQRRMRADGQWEVKGSFGKWRPENADDDG